MNEDFKKWLPWALVGALAVIIAVLVFVSLGDSEPEAAATTSTGAETTTTPPASTTTVADATTSTTTSAPPDTTTTSAPPETTTTTAAPDTVELTRVGVQAGDTWVPFAENDEVAIAAVSAVLGVPDHDSGWVDALSSPYGVCPPPVVRGVHWGDLVLMFTQAETDFWTAGVPHFYAFNYTNTIPELFTPEGIGIGSSLEQLDAAYGGPDLIIDEAWFDPSAGFWSYKMAPWTGLWGFATGQTFDDVVNSINGGQGCGE